MSTRLKITMIAAAALATTALFAPHAVFAKDSASGNPVVATVNGGKILKSDVTNAIQTLPQLQGADTEKVFPMVVDQIINEKLLDTETAKTKITDDADFKKRLDILKSQLIKQVYLERFLKDKVTDAQVHAEYEKFKKDNEGKEEIHARHILVPTEEEAKQVIKDLDGGAKFEDLAQKRSSGPTAQRGGDLGYFSKEDMLPEFSDAAFKLKKGEYTKTPVKTQFGWHVILVEDRRARTVPEFKEVEAAIRNKLGQQALDGLVKQLRAKADIKKFDMNGKPVEEPKKG